MHMQGLLSLAEAFLWQKRGNKPRLESTRAERILIAWYQGHRCWQKATGQPLRHSDWPALVIWPARLTSRWGLAAGVSIRSGQLSSTTEIECSSGEREEGSMRFLSIRSSLPNNDRVSLPWWKDLERPVFHNRRARIRRRLVVSASLKKPRWLRIKNSDYSYPRHVSIKNGEKDTQTLKMEYRQNHWWRNGYSLRGFHCDMQVKRGLKLAQAKRDGI